MDKRNQKAQLILLLAVLIVSIGMIMGSLIATKGNIVVIFLLGVVSGFIAVFQMIIAVDG